MENINKSFALILILIMAISSFVVAKTAFAQSIPKPSVPEFTIQVIVRSYDEPTSYYTNPYTGKIITYQGYHIENKTIEIKIKNQQFNNYDSSSGKTLNLYYNISAKGHFGDDWMYYPENQAYAAFGSTYTTLTFLTRGSSNGGFLIPAPWGGYIDVKVQALIGYYYTEFVPDNFLGSYVTKFAGQKSEWSNIQTIHIPETSTSTSPTSNPTPTPTVPEFPTLVIVPLLLSVFSVALLFRHQKSISQNKPNV